MFPTRKRIVLLHLSGQVILTTASLPFFVAGQGWTDAADLHVGDRLRSSDGQDVPVDAIIDQGEDAVVYQMDAAVLPFPCTGLWPAVIRNQATALVGHLVLPFPCTGLWPAGTLIQMADGPKPIEDIQPGDRIVVRDRLDPERN